MTRIHPTAVIDPSAVIADDAEIAAYVVVEKNVEIGPGCFVGPFCRFEGPIKVGPNNRFTSHCSVGAPPQDISYAGDPTGLEIGEGNLFREFCTFHRGTVKGGGITRIGSHSMFMTGCHVAHDCQVGDHVIFANSATLAGHVEVGDFASVGAFSAVHQFCRVGNHAFLGGFTVATKDCLPFMKTVGGRPAKCYGPNSIGLERRGFDEQRRAALKEAWRLLHSKKLTASEAVERIKVELAGQEDVAEVLEFIAGSKRGVILANG